MIRVLLFVSTLLAAPLLFAGEGFRILPLGVSGGLREGDLSSYLVGWGEERAFALLDAGSIRSGLEEAARLGNLPGESPEQVIREGIGAILLSHGHLDHVAGLAVQATDSPPKPVLGLAETLDILSAHLFNWELWPNFTNEGAAPRLGIHAMTRLAPGWPTFVPGTGFTVEAWPLSHGPGTLSTAFLLSRQGRYLLYCGDTGPDAVEGGERLLALWRRVAPLVREKSLSGILIEASYPDPRSEKKLYGHLTPHWLLTELRRLAGLAGEGGLAGMPVLVTHVKPTEGGVETVLAQLAADNDLAARFLPARQGEVLVWP